VRMSDIVDDINEKHMHPWSEACQRDGVLNTPLTPFIDQVITFVTSSVPAIKVQYLQSLPGSLMTSHIHPSRPIHT
ncbi:hypothetical protein ElyMa_004484400, partial [Elysia marginata]